MPDPYRLLVGDARAMLATLPAASVHTIVTSPPYFGLRDYGVDGQIGLEATPTAYVAALVDVFREARRVLRDDGTLWLNLGDSFAGSRGGGPPSAASTLRGNGHVGGGPKRRAMTESRRRDDEPVPRSDLRYPGTKPKDLLGIPWRVAFALQDDGWYLRSDIVWHKPNPMPESVTDRPTRAHEYLFLLSKEPRYYYDHEAVKEPAMTNEWPGIGPSHGRVRNRSEAYKPMRPSVKRGGFDGKTNALPGREAFRAVTTVRNRRSVWTIATRPYGGAHFAVFPPDLVRPCIRAGASEHGACGACGAPWRRVVERADAPEVPPSHVDRYGTGEAGVHRKIGGSYQQWLEANPTTTVGWEPTCSCDPVDVVPCTVLDPFNGAGTTGLVALQEGRRYVGIELNPEYAELTRERLEPVAAQPILF